MKTKKYKNKLWTGLSSALTFLLCLAVIGTNVAMGYVGIINSALGISTSKVIEQVGGSATDTAYFKSDYGDLTTENLQKLIADTYEQCITEAQEGSVLLKNDNQALPLSTSETRVTLFGHAVVQPLYRNSSAGSSIYESEVGVDLYEALSAAGFQINDKLYSAYQASPTKRDTGGFNFMTQESTEWSFGEENISFYSDELQASWANDYNDVAIVMLARAGGEGSELFMEDPVEGISQLALHQTEKDLLNMIKDSKKFSKTIVLINSGNTMEVGWLDEYDVDACLWIGCPGVKGFVGVADLLTGAANPSGHLTTTYAVNSMSAPASANNSYNNQEWTNISAIMSSLTDSEEEAAFYAAQAEGIYVGYKYYETRYEDAILGRFNANGTAGSSTGSGWNYQDEVSYPFGYGLSYTSFTQSLDRVKVNADTITVDVTVTNTGDVAGKSAVQIYAQTPYGEYEQQNKVEKSAVQLLDFGKTNVLEPGQSQTLSIECDKYLLASYDYVGAKGYYLSSGNYYIAVGNDAHDALNNILAAKGATGMVDVSGATVAGAGDKSFTWTEGFDADKYRLSAQTGVVVTNQFADCDLNFWVEDAVTYLSRSDWQGTYPVAPTQVAMPEDMVSLYNGETYTKASGSATVADLNQGDNQGIQLITMRGVDYNDTLWDTFMDQLTLEEMAAQVADMFGTTETTSIGKPAAPAGDGPDGIGGMVSSFKDKYGIDVQTCCYTSEGVLASTFNKDLMASRGEMMGEEGLFLGVMEIWGPGSDLQRTPFGGRNFEYYSEDANMNYLCSIPEIEAIQANGVNAGPKHLTGNDQENNREGVACFFNEQAFREGSLRAFEGALAVADAHSVMQGFNRLGPVGCSLSTALNIQVVRNEWGFVGHIETDAIAGAEEGYKSHYVATIMAGTDSFCLDFPGMAPIKLTEAINASDDGVLLSNLRRAAKDILYDVVNSNVMNGISATSIVVQITPWWQPMLYWVIAGLALLDLLCILMLTLEKIKSRKQSVKEGV